jgi:hypothetical protein
VRQSGHVLLWLLLNHVYRQPAWNLLRQVELHRGRRKTRDMRDEGVDDWAMRAALEAMHVTNKSYTSTPQP